MKTQSTQLSLLETKQVSGGFLLNKELAASSSNRPFTKTPSAPGPYITQSLKETGGLFDIVS